MHGICQGVEAGGIKRLRLVRRERSGIHEQTLTDRVDQVVVLDLRDHRWAEALAFTDEQESMRAVKAVGEDHAGCEFVEEDFLHLMRELEQVSNFEEKSYGFRVERFARFGDDGLDRLFFRKAAFDKPHGDSEAACSPRDG